VRTPASASERSAAWPAQILPRLREAARATRPLAMPGSGEHRSVLAAPFAAGGVRGAIAFAGSRGRPDRFTATDKDLLGLMAVWLAGELERGLPASPAAASPPPPQPAARAPRRIRARRDRDLNGAVRRAERGLRRRLGTDATLELALAGDVPPVASGRLPLATLVESAVLAVARLAPTGRIRVETNLSAAAGPGAAGSSGEVTLCASVSGDVDASALDRTFEAPAGAEMHAHAGVSLARLERLLRRDGGDVSVAIEPGQRASLTVWLPAAEAPSPAATASAPARPARHSDQPAR
jgi:hypothetical protein